MKSIINAKGLNHYQLNSLLKETLGEEDLTGVTLKGVNGQRYIGAGVDSSIPISIEGVPGQDLGSFAKKIFLTIYGNTQDGTGNTMNDGEIIIHGHGGDILAHSMRGGRILVRDGVGTRVGIHMKGTLKQSPQVIIGGGYGDFLGEYMAGGMMIILRLQDEREGQHIGTGMHGGRIYLRGQVKRSSLGDGLKQVLLTPNEDTLLFKELKVFCQAFALKRRDIYRDTFTLITPISSRPYKNMYAC